MWPSSSMESASQPDLIGADGSIPSSASPRRESWRHVGLHPDVLAIHPETPHYLSIYFRPRCPQCHRTHHPNVTRSAGSPPGERHCNHCKIRWTNPGPQPFCSCHGEPEYVLEHLLYGIYGRTHPHHGLLAPEPAVTDHESEPTE